MTVRNVSDLIDLVDTEFSEFKSKNLLIWLITVSVLLFAAVVVSFLVADLFTKLTAVVAILAVVLTLFQIMLDQIDSWILRENYQRIAEGRDDSILYAILTMKTSQPRIKLGNIYKLDPDLFHTHTLLSKLYD